MNKAKKYLVIGIISLVVMIASIICLNKVVLPLAYMTKAMNAIEKKDTATAKKYIAKLSDSNKEKFKAEIVDFVVYETNQYIAGKLSYDDLKAEFITIEDSKEYKGVTAEGFARANAIEIDKTACSIIKKKSGEVESSDEKTVYNIYKIQSDDTSYFALYSDSARSKYKEIVKDYLEKKAVAKYNDFLDEKAEYEDVNAYVDLINYIPLSSIKISDISTELIYARYYMDDYDEVIELVEEEEYFKALKTLKSSLRYNEDDEHFKPFKKKFQDLYNELYDTTKEKAIEKAKKAIEASDYKQVKDIISDLKDCYGDNVDLSDIMDLLHQPWMDAYIKYMDDWEVNLKKDLAKKVKIGDYLTATPDDFDDYKPKYFSLYDFDNDDVPEMILSYSNIVYIFTYDGNNVVFTGQIWYYAVSESNDLIVDGYVTGDIGVDIHQLLELKGTKWVATKTAVKATKDGMTIYDVDGIIGNDEEKYNERVKEIEEKEDKYFLPMGKEISEYKDYIENYYLY